MKAEIIGFSSVFETLLRIELWKLMLKSSRIDVVLTFVALSPEFFHLQVIGSQIRTMLIDFDGVSGMSDVETHIFELTENYRISSYDVGSDFDPESGLLPINHVEPWMFFNLFDRISLDRVNLQHPLNQMLEVWARATRKSQLT
jgi:hypothetical protein